MPPFIFEEMASKRSVKQKGKSNPAKKPGAKGNFSVQKFFRDERTRKVLGLLLLLLGVLLAVAMGSYMGTWQQDFDKVVAGGKDFFFSRNIKVANALGRLGTFSAHQLMHNGFGIAAFFLTTLPMVWGINLMVGRRYFSAFKNFRFVVLATALVSVGCAFFLRDAQFSYGGEFGNYCSDFLVRQIGKIGTGLLLVAAALGWIIWRFNIAIRIPDKEKLVPKFNFPERKTQEPEAKVVEEKKEGQNPPPIAVVNQSPIIEAAEQEDFLTVNDMLRKQQIASQANELNGESGIVVLPPEPEPEDPMSKFDLHHEKEEEKKAPLTAPPKEQNLPIETPKSAVPKALSDGLELEINPPAADEEEGIQDDHKATEKPMAATLEPYDPSLDLKGYKMPTTELLEAHGSEKVVADAVELEKNKNQIIETLGNYDIHIQRIAATVGPTVTLYEIVPAPGVRISRIKNLEDDIALSLAALGIRIIAPIPGRGTIGIEVPNVRKTIVSMKTLLSSEKYTNSNYSLPIAIGKKIDNEHFVVDLASMPHLLMAGATGQGKSVGINAVLVSLLYKKHPSQLKLVLVDPKKVELSLYRAIEKHYLAKLPGEEEAIITDTRKVVHTLNALCIEMDNRYDLLKEAGVRNIREYNEKFIKRKLNPQKGHQYLPFIVLVIDEFADLIMTAGKEIEMPIARLAQLARAVGIHLIIATQRPSVNIITGTIKANFPSRVAFKVSSKIDSRTILDAGGAEQLIGKGDMLISHHGELIRLQCAFVDTPEVERVCEFIGDQRGYPDAFLLPEYVDEKELEGKDFDLSDRDKLFDEAARLIVQNQSGSTSLIQRRMKLGYNRAGRLMDQLESAGIVGPSQGSKPREVLVRSEMELEDILGQIP